MKKIIFLIIIASASFVAAQTKYMIYFKDKGIAASASLQKSSSFYKIAEHQLTPQAIERRKQVMGEDNYITFEDIPLNENYIHQVESLGIKIANKLKWFNAVSAYLTDEQINRVKELSCVEKIESVRISKKRLDENNLNDLGSNYSPKPLNKISSPTGLNYGLSLTQNALSDIPTVHDLGINGNNVIIGILDTGFRWKTHNSLKNLIVLNEKDFIQNDVVTENQSGDASNQDAHGTAVFSIMAGFDEGNIVGPAYGAKFLLAKTEYVPTETRAEEDNYAAALEWMEAQGVQITSSSLGYTTFDDPTASYTYANMDGKTTIVAKAANLAFDRGVSTFTAAGNEGNYWGVGKGGIVSPGDSPNMLTVGAVDANKLVASFSSRGPTSDGRLKPEIMAMGVSDRHAVAGGNYASGNGTSYATPIAAGVAGLLKSTWTHLTNAQIRKTFIECGDKTTTPDNNYGYGLISAKRVISYPNLSRTNTVYNVLNKVFIDANGVNASTVRLNYKIETGLLQTVSMNSTVFNTTLKYYYSLPATTFGNNIEFYFTYQNNSGVTVREPVGSSNYKFSYGSMNISNLTSVENIKEIPAQFYLEQNYPNPFNPSTVISYKLAERSNVTLKVFDMLGREVAVIVNEEQQPGIYRTQFTTSPTGRQVLNSQLSSSVYFYRLQAGNFVQTKKMMLLK